jgi:hypothetical protein
VKGTSMGILDIVSGTLPPTKTHDDRRWTWVPTDDPTSPGLGVLTIIQGSRDINSYDVDIDGDELLFANRDGAAELYAVRVEAGRPGRCSCEGFHFTKDCKHRHATTALLDAGVIAADDGSRETFALAQQLIQDLSGGAS